MARTKGVGRKLAIYVPKCDEYVVNEVEELMEQHAREGYRTSLSFELIRMSKLGLIAAKNDKIMSMIEKDAKSR